MTKLPIHGFVLAGGKSSRMGQDKALLQFHGQPMIEIAVAKLGQFCAEVSISANRGDLAQYAPIVTEPRLNAGPAAGIEAALQSTSQPWILCIPVDVPLVPADLLYTWASAVITNTICTASYLQVDRQQHPSFCMLQRGCLASVHHALESGEHQLRNILNSLQGSGSILWRCNVAEISRDTCSAPLDLLFSNINTQKELAAAEAFVIS
jgi:molybdenum cofactor guanylyltransferase